MQTEDNDGGTVPPEPANRWAEATRPDEVHRYFQSNGLTENPCACRVDGDKLLLPFVSTTKRLVALEVIYRDGRQWVRQRVTDPAAEAVTAYLTLVGARLKATRRIIVCACVATAFAVLGAVSGTSLDGAIVAARTPADVPAVAAAMRHRHPGASVIVADQDAGVRKLAGLPRPPRCLDLDATADDLEQIGEYMDAAVWIPLRGPAAAAVDPDRHRTAKKPVMGFMDHVKRSRTGRAIAPDKASDRVRKGRMVGVVPSALGLAVLDVDRYTPEDLTALTDAHPPVARARTRSGVHLIYEHPGDTVGNWKWDLHGCGGELRGDRGYVVVWDAGALLDGVRARHDGNLIEHPFPRDVLRRPAPARPSTERRTGTVTVDEATATLEYIDPGIDFDDWIAVGMAIHDAFDGDADGLELWEDWSAGSPDKYEPGECAKQWSTFEVGGGTGWGTAVKLARDGGMPKRAPDPGPDIEPEPGDVSTDEDHDLPEGDSPDPAEQTEEQRQLEAARDLALLDDYEDALALLPERANGKHPDPAKLIADARSVESLRMAILTAMEATAPFALVAGNDPPGEEPESVVTVRTRHETATTVFPVLRRGEVTTLGAAGGAGKSFLTLQIAGTAAAGGGTAAGFDIAPGPAIVWSSEGGASKALRRLKDLGLRGVHVVRDPQSLMIEDGRKITKTAAWRRLRDFAVDLRPNIIVVDPGLRAFDIENPMAPRPIRRCLEAMTEIALAADCAVLMVTHSTKASRYEASKIRTMHPSEIGAHAFADSREWLDTSRWGLFLYSNGYGQATLLNVKANDSREGWAVKLEARVDRYGESERFSGFSRVKRMAPEAVADERRASAPAGGHGKGRRRTDPVDHHQEKVDRAKTDILATLRGHDGGMDSRTFRERVGRSRAAVQAQAELVADGMIASRQKGRQKTWFLTALAGA